MKKIENHWLKTTGYSDCIFLRKTGVNAVKSAFRSIYLPLTSTEDIFEWDLQRNCNLLDLKVVHKCEMVLCVKRRAQTLTAGKMVVWRNEAFSDCGSPTLDYLQHFQPVPVGQGGCCFSLQPHSEALKPPSTHRKQHRRLLKWSENCSPFSSWASRIPPLSV